MSTHHDSRNSTAGNSNELTIPAIVIGLILAVVMGAANVYLGLRVGMTVSASIPAAVIAMAVLNGLMGRKSVLEANLVQTSASAGESLAAGIIFTIPALILVGVWKDFDYWTTTLIAFTGGLLGILFMIPMRRVFVVENTELKFPEGLACAEVLRTAEHRSDGTKAETGAAHIFLGLAVGAVFKFVQSFLGLLKGSVQWATIQSNRVFYFGADIAPALIAVGAIVGLSISVQIFIGGAIGWLVTIPLVFEASSSGESAVEVAFSLWSSEVRYMGVGAMVVGGLVSIWNVRHGLVTASREMLGHFRPVTESTARLPTERDISGKTILLLSVVTLLLIGGIYYSLLGTISITLFTTVVMVVMSFFLTAVASYIVGLVGNSNSPVSGMTITAVLGTGAMIYLFNSVGALEAVGSSAIVATLGVAGIVCCVACTAGDVCNDLKTGYLVGATPRNQQIMQVGGVFVAAFVMAPVMTVLHQGSINEGTGGIGGKTLPAPQAVLFSKLAAGFFGDGKLPWDMVAAGAVIGVALIIADYVLKKAEIPLRLHVMPVAVGIYLPFGLAVPILIGGFLNYTLSRTGNPGGGESRAVKNGVLVSSGVIAGESLVGVFLGFLAYMGIQSKNLAEKMKWSELIQDVVSITALLLIALWIYLRSSRRLNRT